MVAAGLFFAGLVFTNYNLSKIEIRALGVRSGFVWEEARFSPQLFNRAKRTRYNLLNGIICVVVLLCNLIPRFGEVFVNDAPFQLFNFQVKVSEKFRTIRIQQDYGGLHLRLT